MHAQLAGLLLIASAVILSFVSVMTGEVVIFVFRTACIGSVAEWRAFVPAPTLFVSDHPSLVVILLAAVGLLALAAVWRLPEQTLRCVAVGLCTQWLVVWVTAFCLCYDGFLGSVSMHHPQWFEFDEFLSLRGGVFPLSFVLIVTPLITAFWPARISRRTRQA